MSEIIAAVPNQKRSMGDVTQIALKLGLVNFFRVLSSLLEGKNISSPHPVGKDKRSWDLFTIVIVLLVLSDGRPSHSHNDLLSVV